MSIDHAFFAWFIYVVCSPIVLEMSSHPALSAALVAANKRLHKMRERINSPSHTSKQNPVNNDQFAVACLPIVDLPMHLGWHSEAVSQVIRKKETPQPRNQQPSLATISTPPPHSLLNQSETVQKVALSVDLSQSVKVYPDIALAMLREEQAAAGRLWLILRHLDVTGRGVLRVVNIKSILTQSKTSHRLCGWRQLRNLLRQGEGVYWHRDKDRVWLRSTGRVSMVLGVTQLTGRPVAVPVKHLFGSIGEARAYLYASFHAGRQSREENRLGQKPIARDTLTILTGVTAECQRGYERRVGVCVNRNYVVGENDSASINKEERIWQKGGSAFRFVDYHGDQGKPGQSYIAWQLPNSYSVALTHQPKGRQKRINRMLSDLFMQGMTGNEQRTIDKRYFGDGASAAKAEHIETQANKELFWLQHGSANGRLRMWYAV